MTYAVALSSLLALLHATHGVLIDPILTHPFRPCCFGDATYGHGEVVLTLEQVCLQLVCNNGLVEKSYLGGEAGQTGCCEFDGQLYADSDTLTSHCIDLQCRDSCWYPQDEIQDCCRRCLLTNDPHFNSFDGQHYHFHGKCNYSLAQQGSTQFADEGIYGDFRACNGDASCLDRTMYSVDAHTKISLSTGALFDIEVNGFPNHITVNKVHHLRSADRCHPALAWRTPFQDAAAKCITVLGANRIMIQHCRNRLDIIAHPVHTAQLDGLCGHLNDDKSDDFTARDGVVHDLESFPDVFPKSWKTNVQSDSVCQPIIRSHGDAANIATNPCLASDEEFQKYLTQCREKLAIVRGVPNINQFIENCAMDLCVMEQYGAGEDIDFWLGEVEEIVQNERTLLARMKDKDI